jgi:hypothetical protein
LNRRSNRADNQRILGSIAPSDSLRLAMSGGLRSVTAPVLENGRERQPSRAIAAEFEPTTRK